MTAGTDRREGPLSGTRVVELAGLGPAPFAAMLLGDLGADVVRVDRPGGQEVGPDPAADLTNRNKRALSLDLKSPAGVGRLLDLAARADVLVEGYRLGVAERLGVGPGPCHARNPRLVYGRMTGWGQDGPLSATAGHDIGYLARTGALGMTGPAEGPPVAPANLLGDYAGGSLYLVVGVLAALHHARATGEGQVVDAAIVDGVAHLSTFVQALLAAGMWEDRRAANLLDGGRPYYGTYATSDGGHMAVGPLERRFYAEFVRLLGIEDAKEAAERDDPAGWPALRALIAARFATRTRAEWSEVFAGSDACVEPVLSLREAHRDPHLRERGTFTEYLGTVQPAPAPRFSRTPASLRRGPAVAGADTAGIARDWDLPGLTAATTTAPAHDPAPATAGPRRSEAGVR
ncbi:CaiB/BaiF CoA transferase family protein, partial [Streptomyces sp. SBT349]|uniref:CaiB/BaiF CoA transferase family protein n=1 Tax=Streptomyces sp. SBT349 TaxID=1580539 RepID=UPI00066E01BD